MDLYTVICRREHATFKVFVAAETAEEAAAEAKRRGHDVDQVWKAGVWTRGREAEIAARLLDGRGAARERERGCRECGYSLRGLREENGWVVCPECGSRQMRPEAFGRAVRRASAPGVCERCGYALEGLPEEDGWVVCPECGGWQERGQLP